MPHHIRWNSDDEEPDRDTPSLDQGRAWRGPVTTSATGGTEPPAQPADQRVQTTPAGHPRATGAPHGPTGQPLRWRWKTATLHDLNMMGWVRGAGARAHRLAGIQGALRSRAGVNPGLARVRATSGNILP
jgi:hypothetical protein